MRIGVLTFHNTPNFGATLQCYALVKFLEGQGHEVEVVNYMPTHNMAQYAKFLFLGRRRSIRNVGRIFAFRRFLRDNVKMSGMPIFKASGLKALSRRYDLAITGSDEVWKIDHMRRLDASFYLDFCDPATTRTASYAASASTVTDLRNYAGEVRPLLERLSAISIRDPSTGSMVKDLVGVEPVEVVDPTMIWDFDRENLPPMHDRPYVALYAWLDDQRFADVAAFARAQGLDIVSVGCRNRGSTRSFMGIGPHEWLRLMKGSRVVVTDFFHGAVFAMLFRRPFYAFVDSAKRMKLKHVLEIAGIGERLHESTGNLKGSTLEQLTPSWDSVAQALEGRRELSRGFLHDQLAGLQGKGAQNLAQQAAR